MLITDTLSGVPQNGGINYTLTDKDKRIKINNSEILTTFDNLKGMLVENFTRVQLSIYLNISRLIPHESRYLLTRVNSNEDYPKFKSCDSLTIVFSKDTRIVHCGNIWVYATNESYTFVNPNIHSRYVRRVKQKSVRKYKSE